MAHATTTANIGILSLDRHPNSVSSATASLFSEPPLTWESISPTRLWDLHPSLHCSIIGTCLTTTELRQILRKAGFSGIEKSSDHDLHGKAVALCSKRQIPSKLL